MLKLCEHSLQVWESFYPLGVNPTYQEMVTGSIQVLEVGLPREAVEAIIDVHNRQHPRSRNRGDNFISMGFSGHYTAMRSRFGDHLTDGIAGENIFVACDEIITPDKLGEMLVIETQAGVQVRLEAVIPTPPCEPFSRFAAGHDLDAPEMKATLQFLSDGTRGFYMRIASAEEVVIRPGDVVSVE